MFNKFKKLVQRIKSLEEHLGVVYKTIDNKDDYAEHVTESSWSLQRRIEKLEGKKKDKFR